MSQGLIQGSMREAPLPDIIQLVSQGNKSGCFHVLDEPKRCKIFLKDGRIVHAVSHDCEGLDAFYQVALWLDGSYRFEEGGGEVPMTITKPNASVLMEMGRRMEEWRVISQRIPSVDLYPASTVLPGDEPQGVNPRQAKLLSMLTGWYTVQELSELLQKPILTVAKDLYDLVMGGQVVMKGLRSGKAPRVEAPPPPAPAPPPPTPSGFPVAEEPPPTAPAPAPLAPTPVPPTPAAPAAGAPAHPPAPASASVPFPAVHDPVKMARLTAFTQRIAQTSKRVLPQEFHELVDRLQARATQQIFSGEGPEAVKNLALAVSRGAVDQGCDADLVKTLNAELKALFSK
ncbi:MAG: DUF4388 domain-containing protein [Acidobacteria bacterium]|nr:DUF4388 domain-containing protein [Acidobacteriota bacterium]